MKTLLIDTEHPYVPPRSGELTVESGVVWLTEAGNSTDLLLRKGCRYSVVGPRRTIVQAMSAGARLSFQPAGLLAQLRDSWNAFADSFAGDHRCRPHA